MDLDANIIEYSSDLALKHFHICDIYSVFRVVMITVRKYYRRKWYQRKINISQSEKLKKAVQLIRPILDNMLIINLIRQDDHFRLSNELDSLSNDIPHLLISYYYLAQYATKGRW
jgi:hypothetical protein